MRRALLLAVGVGVLVVGCGDDPATTAEQLEARLPAAITSKSPGDTLTEVTCVPDGDAFECTGIYGMGAQAARRSLENIGYPEHNEAEVAEWQERQSGTVVLRVLVAADGAITWRPV